MKMEKGKDIFTNKGLLLASLSYKRKLIFGNINAFISTCFIALIPLIFPALIDGLLLSKPNSFISFLQDFYIELSVEERFIACLLTTLGILVFLRVSAIFFQALEQQSFSFIAKDIIAEMRKKILKKVEVLPISYYENTSGGRVISLFVSDLNTIDSFISLTISKFILSIFQIFVVLLIIFFISPKLVLVIVGFYPILVYLIGRISKRIKVIKKKENTLIADLQEETQECIDFIPQIRSDNLFGFFEKKINRLIEKIKLKSQEFLWKSEVAGRLSFTIFLVGLDLVVAIIIYFIFKEQLSIGNLLALMSYFWILSTPSFDIFSMQYAYQNASASLSRINELMNLEEEKNKESLHKDFAVEDFRINSFEFKKVSFSYDTRNVLEELSFSVREKEKVALVGMSGIGKTTILKNIIGIYVPTEGDILFSGVSYKNIGYKKIRDCIGIAFQKPVLFNGTVYDNICLGRAFSQSQVWEALEIAQLRTFIEQLPEKLNSIVGSSGVKLSAGQGQRLSIARLILKKADVYIFDEAMSALDRNTEEKLYLALETALEDKIVLTISHHLNTVKRSKRILVLHRGNIVQDGTHNQLIETDGLYKSFFS